MTEIEGEDLAVDLEADPLCVTEEVGEVDVTEVEEEMVEVNLEQI